MRVLVFEAGYTPYEASFKDGKEAVERVIKADSETLLPFGNEVIALVCSRQRENLPPNRTMEDGTVICGRFLVCGLENETLKGLTHKQADRYYRRYMCPEKFLGSKDMPVSEIMYPRIKPADERIGKKSRTIER